ncbi:GNAT family N-acetyltransferase [Beduini massiliensis]|uniref:GNAT family N-acetyltransferase n=1 Tax=Beduini massiliensis TaxID=1585974 RepID=UPI00059A7BC1|nr:GNAT family N-acetyltransferase [Beduini massiliensis]
MEIEKLSHRDTAIINQLMHIWESSVRATHLFLKEEDILRIAEYVPEALLHVPTLITAKKEGSIIGFMGIDQNSLEMLFISSKERGQGIGKKLLEYAILHEGVDCLTVNEQNPQAKGFYEHMGFMVERRSECDDQGNPFPLLYMRYKRNEEEK